MRGVRSLGATALALLLLGSAACGGNQSTPFPPGLKMIEQVSLSGPPPDGSDKTPEKVVTSSGSTSSYDDAQARGYIHEPLSVVYAALQDPDVVVDRRSVAKYTVTHNVESGYDVSFRVHNTIYDIVTVEFDMTWREGVTVGTRSAPTQVNARAEKTAGTAYISLMEVSIQLNSVSDGVTLFQAAEHISAASSSASTIELYLKDVYASLLAKSHGQPLPTY